MIKGENRLPGKCDFAGTDAFEFGDDRPGIVMSHNMGRPDKYIFAAVNFMPYGQSGRETLGDFFYQVLCHFVLSRLSNSKLLLLDQSFTSPVRNR